MVNKSKLKRPIHLMPEYIQQALADNDLDNAYQARPSYQQNDYIGWISRAKRQETQLKRLQQMLDELQGGNKYMGMNWGGAKND